MSPAVPPCDCHGEAMRWQKDRRRKDGGRWVCAVKAREYQRRHYAKNRNTERARNREYHATNAEQVRARKRREYAQNPAPSRERHLLRRYGVSLADYDAMLSDQDGACLICDTPPNGRPLAVDHDHDTGEVRGLLCFDCNTSIGKLRDDPRLLRAAIAYLEVANDFAGSPAAPDLA